MGKPSHLGTPSGKSAGRCYCQNLCLVQCDEASDLAPALGLQAHLRIPEVLSCLACRLLGSLGSSSQGLGGI